MVSFGGRTALSRGDEDSFEFHLNSVRNSILAPLSAAGRESHQRAYPFLVQLHMLAEIEQVKRICAGRQRFVSSLVVSPVPKPHLGRTILFLYYIFLMIITRQSVSERNCIGGF